MVNILRERTQNAEMAPMHRLGRGTTGAIIFAKNVATRKFLAKAFRENKIEKYYLALIRGVPTEDRFTVEQPIGLVPYQGFSQKKLLWAASAIVIRRMKEFLHSSQSVDSMVFVLIFSSLSLRLLNEG
jgi:23S rRNA-/tRNA-specific pseudouridylate synthase